MATVNIYIGCNDKDTHKQLYELEYIKQSIIHHVNKFYDSFSIALIDGVYRGEIEKTFKVSVMIDIKYNPEDVDVSKISKCARTLRDKLNQQCIMVETIKDSIISFV